ncbi:MAG TPA: hypothetical protein VG388_08720 [Solirubrobacteraceae bacterium]|nr:hypothetical protein [Solirubrobacteraceae bacterium]
MAPLQRSHSEVPARPPFMKRVAAGAVLAGVVAIGIFLLISVIKTILIFALVIAVIVAVLWALKTVA